MVITFKEIKKKEKKLPGENDEDACDDVGQMNKHSAEQKKKGIKKEKKKKKKSEWQFLFAFISLFLQFGTEFAQRTHTPSCDCRG